MMTRRDVIGTGLAALGTAALGSPGMALANASGYGIAGRAAPELEVGYWIDRFGDPTRFNLTDHDGKWVYLKCFQSWCPGCHSHGFPALKKISDALSDNSGIVFAGIQTVFEGHDTNTVDKLREIQLRYELQMPIGHDPGGEAGHPQTMIDYRTGGTPWMVLISPERRVVFNDFGIDTDKAIEFLQGQTA